MPNTTNFNFPTPADTDLVKDGASAIRSLGNSIDTAFVDLKGGTTGQILSKASNTDLDYTWIANDQGDITEVSAGTGISVASGTGPVPVVTNTVATTFDAKGDLVVGTGPDTFAKLPVGTNGHTLVADSSVSPQGLKWAVDPVADVVTTAGDLLYATAADTVTRLGIGTAGQVLKVNSGATAPEWGAAGATSGPAFAVYSTTDQSFSAGSTTKVTWNTEEFDTAGNFASNRFTPTTAGYYQINACCGISQSTSNYMQVEVQFNGTLLFRAGHATASSNVVFSGGQVVYFNGSSDYVEVFVFAQGTSPIALKDAKQGYFSGVWIRS